MRKKGISNEVEAAMKAKVKYSVGPKSKEKPKRKVKIRGVPTYDQADAMERRRKRDKARRLKAAKRRRNR